MNVCGTYPKAKVITIALNTSALSEEEALAFIQKTEEETGVPATDLIRFGTEKLGQVVTALL